MVTTIAVVTLLVPALLVAKCQCQSLRLLEAPAASVRCSTVVTLSSWSSEARMLSSSWSVNTSSSRGSLLFVPCPLGGQVVPPHREVGVEREDALAVPLVAPALQYYP